MDKDNIKAYLPFKLYNDMILDAKDNYVGFISRRLTLREMTNLLNVINGEYKPKKRHIVDIKINERTSIIDIAVESMDIMSLYTEDKIANHIIKMLQYDTKQNG